MEWMAVPTAPTLRLTRSLLRAGDRVCVAVSGGADSVGLLLGLCRANAAPRESLGVGISAVHVHHGLRGEEADEDQRFVEGLCRRLDIPLHVHHVDVPGQVAGGGGGVEESARELRYGVFSSLLAEGHADAVLTAHTLEDQAETVLMKLLRGAWTAGLSGIYPVLNLMEPTGRPAGRVLRPLLGTHRHEIEAFLVAVGQHWREDASNADLNFTRNRIRLQVMPQLRSFNATLDETLAQVAELAREDEERWREELKRILPQILLPGRPSRGGGRSVSTRPELLTLSIEIARLQALDQALRRRVLRAAAAELGSHLDFDETLRLLALCGFVEHPNVSSRPGARLELSRRLRAERSPRELRLSKDQLPKS